MEYTFPAPPVCTVYWNDRAWKRYARQHGTPARKGPAPSVRLGSMIFHFVGFDARGVAMYGNPTPSVI
jgi:hypothetical protein